MERSMRPVFVVMLRIDGQDAVEMPASEDKDAIEAVIADGAHPALGEGVRVRCWHGVRITSIPSLRKTSSNARLNFVSRS